MEGGGWGGDPLCCRLMRAAPGCSLSLVGAGQTGTRAAGQGVGDSGGSRQLRGMESKAGPQAGPALPARRFSTRGRPRGRQQLGSLLRILQGPSQKAPP